MPDNTYQHQRELETIKDLRKILLQMPDFCDEFFRAISPETTALTRINYARDLMIFFEFLTVFKSCCQDKSIAKITTDDIDQITLTDIETYLDYLTLYEHNGRMLQDQLSAKERKLSSIRTLFRHLFKKHYISSNVATLADMPKLHTKEIVRLEVDEVARLLDYVDSGEKLTDKQGSCHQKTRLRDLAMIALMLGTGIRVSECVGIDMNDIDFNINGFRVVRKGGQQALLYFSDEVADILREYFDERTQVTPMSGHEHALFLSMQKKRIDVRSVQNLVKKYAKPVSPLKTISPHKLRTTFGTNLYAETNDIYVVADVLGHADVNTTRKHYAAISDTVRRNAARRVRLRDEE